MRFRKLRIAWSVFWRLAAVLLVMLCMRSYWWQDGFAYDRISGLTSIYISTCPGGFWFETNADPPFPFGLMPRQPQIYSTPYSDSDCPELHSGFRPFTLYANTGGGQGMLMRFWVPVLVCGVIAIASGWCLPMRFSLRTLLIATTLVAAMLGIAIYAAGR